MILMFFHYTLKGSDFSRHFATVKENEALGVAERSFLKFLMHELEAKSKTVTRILLVLC